jgi:hypothetical protein
LFGTIRSQEPTTPHFVNIGYHITSSINSLGSWTFPESPNSILSFSKHSLQMRSIITAWTNKLRSP